MKQIVYLFGAGASREVLPIVTEIPDRLNKLIEKLELEEYQLSDTDLFDLGDNKRSYQEVLIDDLKWLKSESATHASIDTFVKKLYIKQKHDDLYKLKLTLTAFFIFEQLGKRADLRYDTFYASILRHHSLAFPTNINILSWNYDYQFELSYAEYRENDTIAESALNITSKFSNKDLYNKVGFSIYKLNGSTSFNLSKGLIPTGILQLI